MKRILVKLATAITLVICQLTHAQSGLFFEVTPITHEYGLAPVGMGFNIITTIPNHTYPSAGIRVNTPGYKLTNPGTDCIMVSTGYCIFQATNSTPHVIYITAPLNSAALISITLCLNGNGPLSCQNYTVESNTPS